MSVPKNYNKRILDALGAKAVWEPGAAVELGDILTTRDGMFHPSGKLSEYGIAFDVATSSDRKLNLISSGTVEKFFQAGAEVGDIGSIQAEVSASVEYSFKGEFEYVLKTQDLDVFNISNVNQVAKAVLDVADWRHDKWYIVERIYKAEDWTFLGNRKTAKSFKVSGKGSAVQAFVKAGASAGVSTTGSVSIEMLGAGGALAMRLVRIRKDGTTNRG
jgi:hypothetical protein